VPARAASFDNQTNFAKISLFDPHQFLAVIAVLFWPLKFLPPLLAPAAILAGLTSYKHWNDITGDLHRMFGDSRFIVHLIISLLVVNLSVRLTMGSVVRAFGGAVRDFGIVLFLGIIPRFYVDRSAIPHLPRAGQLWSYGAPLLVRLGFFAFGMLAWATYRSNGTWAADLALVVAQAGFWSFLFVVMPFIPSDGYNLLSTYLRQPMRLKAFVVLGAKLRGKNLPRNFRSGETTLLILFAIGAVFVLIAFVLAILTVAAVQLTRNLQGVGVAIFLVMVAALVTWYLSYRAMRPQRIKQQIRTLRAAMVAEADAVETEPARTYSTRRLLGWTGVGVVLIVVACLPYSYNPAGPFVILPAQTSKVSAQIEGEVVDVLVHEGDWVNAGQVIAHLSSSVQRRNTVLTREELDRAKARLAQQESAASLNQHAIAAARDEVDRLRLQLQNDQAQLDRASIRAPMAGLVTTPDTQLMVGRWLNAGDRLLQIDDTRALQAEIKIPEDDVGLVKLGAEVRLRPWAATDGEIVGRVISITPVDTSAADAGASRPAPTTKRRVDAVADMDREAVGENKSAASVETFRRRARMRRAQRQSLVSEPHTNVRVEALIPNAGTLLRPGMTGYAKISGPKMSLGEAYFRLCIRFLILELWSWVP